MEIDLELPIGHGEKLDIASNTSFIDGTNDFLGEKENVSSPRTSEPMIGNCEADVVRSQEGLQAVNTGGIIYEPRSGLEFESKEAAYCFYKEYAMSIGFGITIKASRRSKKSGKFIDVKIACSRFGNKRESTATANSRSCPKTDCKAGVHMKKREDGAWFIYNFVKEHNHDICHDDIYSAIRGRSNQPGVIPCLKKGLQLALGEGDVQVLFENFTIMQAENPNFLYVVDLDQEKRMRNVFWVDAKGRNDYKNFCDVVFFDTYYVKQKYNIPFAPIFGVNHHFQYILLGCALIGDETTSTFVWLMRTWLKAMSGQAPTMIITDEDKSINEAIAEVFPDARHYFCLWHILRKISVNLDQTVNRFENFSAKFRKCIHRSWADEEFEKRWWKLVDKFQLREDEWIRLLYEDRKKWVPTYISDTSLVGLSTVERGECISSTFDKYIESGSSLKEFMGRYKAFLRERYEEEGKADFETRNKQPTIRTLSPFEKQMSLVYTHTIFKKFQVEALGIDSCNLQKRCEGDTTVTFLADDFEERQKFIVTWSEAESNICCSCHSFEYKGFLCRHALRVLQISGISNIPPHYILKRWTKDAKIKHIMEGTSKRLHCRVQRFNDLCKLAIKLGEEGSLSQECYTIAFSALEEALKHCVHVNNSVRSIPDSNMLASQGKLHIGEENGGSNRPVECRKKKLQKRQKELLHERANSFGLPYVAQQDIQGMDLSSRPTNFEGYFGVQQDTQGEVQLNSMPSLGDGYNTNRHRFQGQGPFNSAPTRVGNFSPQQNLHALLQGGVGFRAPTMQRSFGIQDNLHDVEDTVNITSQHVQEGL